MQSRKRPALQARKLLRRENDERGEACCAESLDVNPSTITRHVRRLVEDGEVTLFSDTTDGRASLVQITDRGRAHLRRIYDGGVDSFLALVQAWTNDEVRTLTSLLDRLMATAEAAQAAQSTAPAREQTVARDA